MVARPDATIFLAEAQHASLGARQDAIRQMSMRILQLVNHPENVVNMTVESPFQEKRSPFGPGDVSGYIGP